MRAYAKADRGRLRRATLGANASRLGLRALSTWRMSPVSGAALEDCLERIEVAPYGRRVSSERLLGQTRGHDHRHDLVESRMR